MISDMIDDKRLAEGIMDILCARKISRAKPTGMIQIEHIIADCLRHNRNIELLGLWGGSKEGVPGDEADNRCLESSRYIKNLHHDLRISILFCDSHHIIANGISPEECNGYHDALRPLARQRDIAVIRLSELVNSQQIYPYEIMPAYDSARDKDILLRNQDNPYYEKALRHSRLVGKEYIDRIVRLYISTEANFLSMIYLQHPDTIFFSMSDPAIQRPIAEKAQVPMFYFYADVNSRMHRNEVPWYSVKKE